MNSDGFRSRYTTIPLATYKNETKEAGVCYSHYHKEIELITVTEGEMDFYIGTDCYKMKAGEVLLIPPYCVHRSISYLGASHECVCFDASLLWDEGLRRDLERGALTVNSHLSKDMSYTPDVYACARAVFRAHEMQHAGWEMIAIGNLSVMFGILCENAFFVKSAVADPEQAVVKRVMEYIKEHFSEPITSGTVAETLYLNNSYFCRLFKKSFGCCFTDFLVEYRIEQAKFYLSGSDRSISEIASLVGFNSFSYFSKTFRSLVGSTPSEYRSSLASTEK